MDGIVREARTALRWVHQHLATLEVIRRVSMSAVGRPAAFAAMLMDEALVAGGLAISGLFDLEPSVFPISTRSSVSTPKRRAATARCSICLRVRPSS